MNEPSSAPAAQQEQQQAVSESTLTQGPESQGHAPPPEDGLTRWLRRGVIALVWLALALGAFTLAKEVARHEAANAVRHAIAVVDLEQALALQRASYLKIMTDDQASEQDKSDATAFIKSSADRINQALAQIAQECDCILLIRPAVLQYQSAGLADHTQRLLDLVSAQVAQPMGIREK